jgi:hypothetical protein
MSGALLKKSRRVSDVALRITIAVIGPLAAHATLASGNRDAVQVKLELQKNNLTIIIDAPMSALVSFTGQAKTPEEKTELDKAMTTLKSATVLFETAAAAGCSLQIGKINLEASERTLAEPATTGGSIASIPPPPAAVQAEGTGGHFVAEYSGICEKPKLLNDVGTAWFELFPKTKMIKASGTRDGKAIAARDHLPSPKTKLNLGTTTKKSK